MAQSAHQTKNKIAFILQLEWYGNLLVLFILVRV